MKHLALIMDGNRRWAKKQGWQAYRGHSKGVESVKKAIEFCLAKHIPYLSLYTFSIENFRRSPEEQRFLFELLVTEAEKQLPVFIENKIRVRFIGDRSLFPSVVLPTIQRIEQQTADFTTLHVSLLFCYGGRQEIVSGIKELIRKVRAGLLSEDHLSEEVFEQYLWTYGIPEPDLIIRTSGHQRLSNFLLYQAAYSQLYFLDCMWPELETHHLEAALSWYQECQQNIGA